MNVFEFLKWFIWVPLILTAILICIGITWAIRRAKKNGDE